MGLFNYDDLKNHPRRSGFDLSKRIEFTGKPGELLPVYWKFTVPGDKFNIRTSWFTRTEAVNTAAYTRVKEYVDWFFVPLNLLQKGIESAITQMVDNPVSASAVNENREITTDLPWTTLSDLSASILCLNNDNQSNVHVKGALLNQFGYSRADLAAKFLQMLKYGNFINKTHFAADSSAFGYSTMKIEEQTYLWNNAVSILPVLTYQRIYTDFFRFEQWENPVPYLYNADYYTGGNIFSSLSYDPSDAYWQNTTPFDMQYCNWNRDLFTGMLPSQQFGDAAVVDVGASSGAAGKFPVVFGNTDYQVMTTDGIASRSSKSSIGTAGTPSPAIPADTPLYAGISGAEFNASFTILALRQAEFLQKWKEIALSGSPDYRTQVEKHFGVKLPVELSYMSQYIGGQFSQLDISEVVNNNLESGSQQNQAIIAGKGVNTGNGSISFSPRQHGIIMGIYHAVPLLEYVRTGQDADLLITQATDWAIPEFDAVGMQTIPLTTLFNSNISGSDWFTRYGSSAPLGYVPRFINWKTDIDEVFGKFRSSAKDWVAPIDAEFITQWVRNNIANKLVESTVFNANWFKVNPAILDSIFAVKADSTCDTDPFKINMSFDIKAVRPFDYSGMPY
nr:MAG TPA: Major capsid protein [Microviridae sp.]